MSRDGINCAPPCATKAIVEVALPLRVSHAWIAFASQKAGLSRPRWDHEQRIWTVGPAPLFVTCPGGDRTMRVEADAEHVEIVRRFVSALLTGMFQRTRRGADQTRSR